MKRSGSLAKVKLPEPISPLEPYKDRLHIINGLHGIHTSPSHSAFFGALGGYRGSDGVPPSASTIDYELSKILPQTLLPHLCIGMDSIENMRTKPTIATLSASGAGQPLFSAKINSREVTFQQDKVRAGMRLFRRGAQVDVMVCTPRAAEFNRHMIEKVPPDLSRFLLSPMPGLLVQLSVKVGDEVKAGEELAVVEAMKMENSLRAENDGVITKVLAEQGDSLVVDQPILEFE